jgi:hypothetical protein
MQLAAIPRWQWVVIAIAIGTIVGLVSDAANSQVFGVDHQGYGLILTDQLQFENALTQDFKGVHLFADPVVHPRWIPDAQGRPKLVYIVSGQYWNGHPQSKNGQAVAEWMPRCIITQTPYRSRTGVRDNDGHLATEFPSVVEFLVALHRSNNLDYQVAWWELHPIVNWIAGCTILIGGLWPTLANLLAFGTFTRPRTAKAVSLWHVRRPKQPHTPAISYSSSTTEQSEQPSTVLVPAEIVANAATVPLGGAPLEALPENAKEARSFGAEKDDFYPTQRHAARQPAEE